MEHARLDEIMGLLNKGYAQNTVAKRTGLTKDYVGAIARHYGVGRRVGDTRTKVVRKVARARDEATPTELIERFINP